MLAILKHPMSKMVGLSILAVASTQIIQGLLLLLIMPALQSSVPAELIPWLVLSIAIVSRLAGGLFLGRVLSSSQPFVWLISGVVNELLYLIEPLIGGGDSFPGGRVWISVLGGLLTWYIGAYLGRMSTARKPDPELNVKLIKGVSIGVGVIVFLNLFIWGSIHLSKGFRLAGNVELPVPETATELEGNPGNPWIAQFKRFEMEVPPNDRSIPQFYKDTFAAPNFEDVSHVFQEKPGGEWYHLSETAGPEPLDIYALSMHWKDFSGNVRVSLYLRADRVDSDRDWAETRWRVTGSLLAAAYAEPEEVSTGDTPGEQPTEQDSGRRDLLPDGTADPSRGPAQADDDQERKQ